METWRMPWDLMRIKASFYAKWILDEATDSCWFALFNRNSNNPVN